MHLQAPDYFFAPIVYYLVHNDLFGASTRHCAAGRGTMALCACGAAENARVWSEHLEAL